MPRRRRTDAPTTPAGALGFLAAAPFKPPTDVMETHDAYVVVVEVAGAEERGLTVTLEGLVLRITGSRADHSAGKRRYHVSEVRVGPFERVIRLPGAATTLGAQARYERGLLRITIPKAATPPSGVLRL